MKKFLLAALLILIPIVSVSGYLTDRDIRLIRKNWSDYRYAAKKVGVPVLALVAIHYREADLYKGYYSKKKKRVIRNVGGPFMLDLGPLNNHAEFARRIRKHEKKVYLKYLFKGGETRYPKVSHNFRFAAVVAAHHLDMKARCGLFIPSVWGPVGDMGADKECLADALWGYNGRAGWHKGEHQNSSYVWSDPKRGVFLKMRYTKKDGTVKEFIDTRPGVMVIYKELVEIFGKGGS